MFSPFALLLKEVHMRKVCVVLLQQISRILELNIFYPKYTFLRKYYIQLTCFYYIIVIHLLFFHFLLLCILKILFKYICGICKKKLSIFNIFQLLEKKIECFFFHIVMNQWVQEYSIETERNKRKWEIFVVKMQMSRL